jgi:hypothetical protein
MKSYHLAQSLALASLSAVAFASCAKGNTETDGAGGSLAATTSGGGSGGTGGTIDLGPCGVDCSAIQTPECQVAVCNETTKTCEVLVAKDGAACEDGLFCTAKDTCLGGSCKAGAPNTCGVAAPTCNEMTCDETTKTCTPTPLKNNTFCTPEDKCEINGACSAGFCIGIHNDCDSYFPPDDCHIGVCNPANGSCEPKPGNEGFGCDDAMDKCTVEKTCSAGKCIGGKPKNCSALSKGCFAGVCNTSTGACEADPLSPGDPCAEATDACNSGTCDVNGKCVAAAINEGKTCDDGLACTANTVCTSGACKGGTSSIDVYFFDEFASNAAGWTLGAEWEIGTAQASVDEEYGNPDPSVDHTAANVNNGVAGVVLGGNASTTPHDFIWLTSPAVNTANAPSVYFEFYRWLNSDYAPYMQNAVEVWNGTAWVNLYLSGGIPGVQDASWTKVSYDLTMYKNAALQVRFGFKVGSAAYDVSQWNIDDVLIASAECK